MKKKLLTAVFLILVMVSIEAAAEQKTGTLEVFGRPDLEAGTTKIEVLIWVLNIDSINSAMQTFDANIFIRLIWKDPRLIHTDNGPVKYLLDKIWNPDCQIANAGRLLRKTHPRTATVQPDGTVNYNQRYVGSFSQPLNLNDFPFDKQKLILNLIAPEYTPEEIQFVPEKKMVAMGLPYAAGISKDISLPDWKILDFKTENAPYLILEGFENAGYAFEILAKRLSRYFLVKVILPLIFIVMMSWVVFWIDPENLVTRIGAAISSMLTLIAYRFDIDTLVPKVSYTTRMDEFIFMSTLLVFLSLIQAILTSALAQSKKVSMARKINFASRIVFPIIFFAFVFITLFN